MRLHSGNVAVDDGIDRFLVQLRGGPLRSQQAVDEQEEPTTLTKSEPDAQKKERLFILLAAGTLIGLGILTFMGAKSLWEPKEIKTQRKEKE
jgi:hypothetical protein